MSLEGIVKKMPRWTKNAFLTAAAITTINGATSCSKPSKPENHDPVIEQTSQDTGNNELNQEGQLEVALYAKATDQDEDELTGTWNLPTGVTTSDETTVSAASVLEDTLRATINTPGEHRIEIEINDGKGGTASHEYLVNVQAYQNQPPTGSITATITPAYEPASMNIQAQGSDPEGQLSFLEILLNNSPLSQTTNANWDTTITDLLEGSYNVTLKIHDEAGNTTTKTINKNVAENQEPNYTGPTNLTDTIDKTIKIEGTATDPEGQPLNWNWEQLSGPSVNLTGENTNTPSFQATTGGNYNFKATINDGFNDKTINVTVNLESYKINRTIIDVLTSTKLEGLTVSLQGKTGTTNNQGEITLEYPTTTIDDTMRVEGTIAGQPYHKFHEFTNITDETTKEIQMIPHIQAQSTYYETILELLKTETKTRNQDTDPLLDNMPVQYRPFQTWQDTTNAPTFMEQLFTYATDEITTKTESKVQFQEVQAKPDRGIYFSYRHNQDMSVPGAIGYTTFEQFYEDGSWLARIELNIDYLTPANMETTGKATYLREFLRAIGGAAFSQDPDHILKQVSSSTTFMGPDEAMVWKIAYSLKDDTDMRKYLPIFQ